MTHSAQDINFLRHLQQPKWQRVTLIWIKGVGWSLVLLTVVLGVILSLVHWSIAKRSVALTQEYEQKKSLLAEEEQEKVKQRGDFLGELPKSFKLSRQGFYPLMRQLSMQPHPDVWLAQFGYSYQLDLVRITGYAMTAEAIQDFISQLSSSDMLKGTYFSLLTLSALNQDIKQSQQASSGSQSSIDHKITYRYEKDRIIETVFVGSARTSRAYSKGSGEYNRIMKNRQFDYFSSNQDQLKATALSEGAEYVFSLQNKAEGVMP